MNKKERERKRECGAESNAEQDSATRKIASSKECG
jgi:hypothetical protein